MANLPIEGVVSFNHLAQQSTVYASSSLLTQYIAYLLSDKVFDYSENTSETASLQKWRSELTTNVFGLIPGLQLCETRLGAGSVALGYVFSPDFDLTKRHIPQSIIATSGGLPFLKESLGQLSLLSALTNPISLHVNSTHFKEGILTSDYVTPMELADDLGFSLVNSTTAQDISHVATLSTLLSRTLLPSIHVYDGLTANDLTRVNHTIHSNDLHTVWSSVEKQLETSTGKHLDSDGKVLQVLKVFNDFFQTNYRPFEYHGHPSATNVLVTFGSTESTLTTQIVNSLVQTGHQIGVVNVRIYRPFIEDEFLSILPDSAQSIFVLGQVNELDDNCNSNLYQDILATLTFAALEGRQVNIVEEKYTTQQPLDYYSILSIVQKSTQIDIKYLQQAFKQKTKTAQISLWTLDESIYANAWQDAAVLASSLVKSNVSIHKTYDNLAQGGLSKVDISTSGITQPFAPNMIFIGSEKILKDYNVLSGAQGGSVVIVALPGIKVKDIENKLPADFRAALVSNLSRLYILDVAASPSVLSNDKVATELLQLALQKTAQALYIPTASAELPISQIRPQLLRELELSLKSVDLLKVWGSDEGIKSVLKNQIQANSFVPVNHHDEETSYSLKESLIAAQGIVFKEVYDTKVSLRPDAGVKTAVVHVKEHRRLTPMSYDRNVFHIEFDLGNSGVTYAIGEALGIHAENDPSEVEAFIKWYGLNATDIVQVPSRETPRILESRTVYQALLQNIDIFGRPPKRFYENLAGFATDGDEKQTLLRLSTSEGAAEFKRRAEVDTITFADVLLEFPSAHPSFDDIAKIVSPLKRREYSIASSQHVTPNSVALLIVTVGWKDPKGRDRFGVATRYLNRLSVGAPVTVSVKPSVMKLPPKTTAPIIMAGLGTGLAPFRAFVQERAYQRDILKQEIGDVLLYLGSRHQREEYLYGEEWEAYQQAGVITLIGAAFSRDQPQKIYIQDRMRQTLNDIGKAYIQQEGSFYLCGPTWPVPDVTEVLQEAVESELKAQGSQKIDSRKEIEILKDVGRFVLEVY